MSILFLLSTLLILTSSNIIIRAPKDLASKFPNSTLKIGLSNFGRIPYGHTITGRLYFDPNNTENQRACRRYNITASENPSVDDSPFILVDKGGCSFVSKVLNIEEARGHAAIIINDRRGEKVENKMMPDDGRGNEVTIPGVLISYEDGLILKDYYTKNKMNKTLLQSIKLEINFEMENKDNIVNYDLWYTPDMEEVYEILLDLHSYQNVLYKYAFLTPHLITYPDFDYSENNNQPVNDCLGSGSYCLNGDRVGIKDGSLLVKEAVRQECVYRIYEESDSENNNISYSGFFNYMEEYYSSCFSEQDFSEECSYNSAKNIGIDIDDLEQCYYDSFIGDNNEKRKDDYDKILGNEFLEKNQELMSEFYINKLPTLTINGRIYLGNWKAEYIFDALCASLIKKPKECYEYGSFEEEHYLSSLTITTIIIIVFIVNVAIFFICRIFIRKRIQERLNSSDINSKIDTVVSSYLAMREVKH